MESIEAISVQYLLKNPMGFTNKKFSFYVSNLSFYFTARLIDYCYMFIYRIFLWLQFILLPINVYCVLYSFLLFYAIQFIVWIEYVWFSFMSSFLSIIDHFPQFNRTIFFFLMPKILLISIIAMFCCYFMYMCSSSSYLLSSLNRPQLMISSSSLNFLTSLQYITKKKHIQREYFWNSFYWCFWSSNWIQNKVVEILFSVRVLYIICHHCLMHSNCANKT